MKFCCECGTSLIYKECKGEGLVKYCEKCNRFYFPQFNTAVSMVVLNVERNKTLFINQYGSKRNILVAGYVNKGETVEDAVKREIKEEIGVNVLSLKYQMSKYWEKSNTILLNFIVTVDTMELNPNWEIDSYQWYDLDAGYEAVASNGLAEYFYKYFYEGYKSGN